MKAGDTYACIHVCICFCHYTLFSTGNRVANLTCSINLNLPKQAQICGSKGIMTLTEPFWCTTTLQTPSGNLDFPLPKPDLEMIFNNGRGMT